MPRRVWIIGAGFSRSLGAPLLPELLSGNMREEVKARFRASGEELAWDPVANDLYHYFGQKYSWADAEGFLEFLDAAAQPDTPQSRRWWAEIKSPPEVLRRRARRVVAAECCAFLQDNPVVVGIGPRAQVSERWLPYTTWGWNLSPDDTIISFNYDRLLEQMVAELMSAASNGAEWEEIPHIRVVTTPDDLTKPGGAKVLKLHGSVDWVPNRKGGFHAQSSYPCFSDDERTELLLGMPGPTKLDASTGHFA